MVLMVLIDQLLLLSFRAGRRGSLHGHHDAMVAMEVEEVMTVDVMVVKQAMGFTHKA